MATAGPSTTSTQSYAQVVKSYQPPSDAVTSIYRTPRTDLAPASTTAPVDRADEWTDISSVTSCDWPSVLDEASSNGDESIPEEVAMAVVTPARTYESYEDPWHDSTFDTRAEDRLATEITTKIHSRKLFDKAAGVGCGARFNKPWHPFPRGCHHPKEKKIGGQYGDLKFAKRKGMTSEMKDGMKLARMSWIDGLKEVPP